MEGEVRATEGSETPKGESAKIEPGSFDEVRQKVLSRCKVQDIELMPLTWSCFRCLGEDLVSNESLPPFSLVTHDGYALSSEDIKGASPENPVHLKLIKHFSQDSNQSGQLLPGQAASVKNGSELPRGADSVVTADSPSRRNDTIIITSSVTHGEGVYKRNSLIKVNQKVMKRGDYITPVRVGILAALGKTEVPVVRPPVIGIVSTGSEIVPFDSKKLQPGKLRDANTRMLAAKLAEIRLPQMCLDVVPDSEDALSEEINRVINQVDGLIVTGGRVDGEKKFISETVAARGELVVDGVKMNPGSSFTFGLLDGCPIFALPGSPWDALLVFDVLVKPAILKMMGAREPTAPEWKGILEGSFTIECEMERFIWAWFEVGKDGQFRVTPLSGMPNAIPADILSANCVIRLAPGRHELANDSEVRFIPTSPALFQSPAPRSN